MMTLVTGGTRSGKSAFAQRRLEQSVAGRLLYVATARVEDDEMAARVVRHCQERGARWHTLEEPLRLAEVLPGAAAGCDGVLVDCVTLWLSQQFFHHQEREEAVLDEVDRLVGCLPKIASPLWLVSNELGSGIVPENRLARKFRDLAGEANQRLAAAADAVFLVTAGLPLQLK